MSYTCPGCEWEGLEKDPVEQTLEICPQCGVEFGNERPENYAAIREMWVMAGRPMWSTSAPEAGPLWEMIWSAREDG